MTLELLKFVVQPVFIERDDDGTIVGERFAEPLVFYTPMQLEAWAKGFLEQVAELNETNPAG